HPDVVEVLLRRCRGRLRARRRGRGLRCRGRLGGGAGLDGVGRLVTDRGDRRRRRQVQVVEVGGRGHRLGTGRLGLGCRRRRRRGGTVVPGVADRHAPGGRGVAGRLVGGDDRDRAEPVGVVDHGGLTLARLGRGGGL